MLLSIAKHASKHGIIPLKKYGQNFIFDSTLCDKIVRVSTISENAKVLEIGPGTGGLTRSILAHKPKSLTIIETDSRCIPLLEEIRQHYPALHIIHNDALKFDLMTLSKPDELKIDIISNLPYQIGTPLLINWLKQIHLISSMTLMLQKEVVERICAKVNTKAYGRLSIICQLICQVEKCFDVSSQAFYPPPKVESAIVKLVPLEMLVATEIIQALELITRLAFSGRRKMVKSSLKKLTPYIEDLLLKLNIDSTHRAENISPNEYLLLAKLYTQTTNPIT